MEGRGLDSSGSRQVQEVGTCRHDNNMSGSVQYGEFLD
jgi:hypothetical protein